MSLRHSGHFRVVWGFGSDGLRRASRRLTGTTMTKYTTAAVIRKVRISLRMLPHKLGPVRIAEKSGAPPARAISGVTRFFTTEFTTAPKATPITTATARSSTFPRRMKSVKPLSIGQTLHRYLLSQGTDPIPPTINHVGARHTGSDRDSPRLTRVGLQRPVSISRNEALPLGTSCYIYKPKDCILRQSFI